MLFTSFAFLFLFLPIVYCIFLIASHYRYLKFISLWLVLASIAFYAFWNPKDLLPLLISICVNYCFYRLMQHYMTSEKTNNLTFSKIKYLKSLQYCVLIVAISANLIFLGYYKYFCFRDTRQAGLQNARRLPLPRCHRRRGHFFARWNNPAPYLFDCLTRLVPPQVRRTTPKIAPAATRGGY